MRRILLAVLAAGLLVLVPGAALGTSHGPGDAFVGLGPADLDTRTAAVKPTADQKGLVKDLGATASWTRFGTAASLAKPNGWLATGLSGSAVEAARSFVRTNKALFGLSDGGVTGLEVVNDAKLAGTDAHAVLFRQRFGDLAAAQDGMIAVGVRDG